MDVTYEPNLGDRARNTYVRQQLTDRSDLGVNVANGNLLVNNRDEQVKGTGQDLGVDRTYNARTACWRLRSMRSYLCSTPLQVNVARLPEAEPP